MDHKRRKSYTIPPGVIWLRKKSATPEKMSEVIDDLCVLDKTLVPLSPAKIIQIEKDVLHPSVTFAEVQTYLFFGHQKMKSVGFKEENSRMVNYLRTVQDCISQNPITRISLCYRTGHKVENVSIMMELEGDSKPLVEAACELIDRRIDALRQEQAFIEKKKKDTP